MSANGDDEGGKNILSKNSSYVCLVTEGKLDVADVSFKKGESFYVSSDSEDIVLSGNYTVFAAAAKKEAAMLT